PWPIREGQERVVPLALAALDLIDAGDERSVRAGRALLAGLLERGAGRRGVTALSALLPYDPSPAAEAASELELLLLDVVRANDLPPPQVNVAVEGFIVDALWPEARLVVEVDGYEFHSDHAAFERDHAKIGELQRAGYWMLPLTYRRIVERPDWVAGAIRDLLEAGPPPPRRAAARGRAGWRYGP
ncbi:MAG: DUF559 domain-containing protein, partial [Solirubrobacterales bacterium]|nr:DUF559 domain-containing protein [Solirubrobacterales bacterium]